MTVKELIKILLELPLDRNINIVIKYEGGNEYIATEEIKTYENFFGDINLCGRGR